MPSSSTSALQLPVSLQVHIQGKGDRYFSGEMAGSRGQSAAVEAVRVTSVPVPNVRVQLQVHQQDAGDGPWVEQYDLAGAAGSNRRLEGFSVRLAGPDAGLYNVHYIAHLQDVGDMGPFTNGQYCGTKAQCRRMEALRIWLEPRNEPAFTVAVWTSTTPR